MFRLHRNIVTMGWWDALWLNECESGYSPGPQEFLVRSSHLCASSSVRNLDRRGAITSFFREHCTNPSSYLQQIFIIDEVRLPPSFIGL